MFCATCGAALNEESQFCPRCGTQRGESSQLPTPKTTGNAFSTAGIICGVISFLFFPIVLGPIGLILGAVAKSKGEERAMTAIIVSAIGLVGGMIFGILVFSTL